MTFLFEVNQLHVLNCTNSSCKFIGLDLETWESPYSAADYYPDIKNEDVNPHRPFIRKRVSFIRRYVGGGKFVDLGCGLGETAIAASVAGFDVWGVDESQNAIAFLNHNYPAVHWTCNQLDTFLQGNERFDVIALFHVLEHIPHPRGFTSILRTSLFPTGFLVIEVPDTHGGLARLRGRRWEYWLAHHVNYFSTVSLRRLLEPCGFRLVHSEKHYHFGYPQGILWRDAIHGTLAKIGLNSIIRTIWQVQ